MSAQTGAVYIGGVDGASLEVARTEFRDGTFQGGGGGLWVEEVIGGSTLLTDSIPLPPASPALNPAARNGPDRPVRMAVSALAAPLTMLY